MKKFMIFLLMTFLYLGTCQARSEASYPKDANLKLLSWVSPTPSQSFLTRSNATGTFDITPSSTVHLGVTSNNSVTFSRPVGAVLESLPGWPAGATVNTVDWKVDGSTFKTGGNTCVVEGLNVGNHTFNCELKLSNGDVWTSNTVNIVVAEENIMLTIVGATQACESDVVTLTAVINGQVQGHTYQWKVDGEAIPGATGQTYSFIPDTLFKTAIENENLSHEFTVEVNRDGCLQTVSPIHPFVILLKPEITLNFPEFVCENSVYNIDASLSGSNSSIQPYQWKWFKNNTLYATTSEATLSLEAVEENLNAEWAVYALFEDLACATDTAKMKADTVKFYEDVPSTFTFNLTNIEDDHHICVNSVARYQASAQVLDHSFDHSKFENATYKWYVNNELVATTNSDIYEFSFPVSGQYLVSVVAIYDNYPCTEFTDSDEMVVEDIPEIAIVGNNVICAGDTTLLGVVPKWEGGLSNDFTYFYTKVASIHWFGNNVLVGTSTLDPYSSEQIGVHSVSEPGVYVATVIFEESGCAASAEFTVTQFGADLQVSASEMLVCPGTTVTLNANVDGWNNENIKYEWNTGDTSSTISAVVDRDSVFTVTASAGDNCSLVQTINVKAIPAENIQLTVKAEVDTICVGGRVKATIENADPDYQGFYTWYLNGFEVAGSNLDTIFFDVNNAGIYSVAATLSNFSCGADTISAVDTFVVVGGNTLVLAGDNVVCPGDTAVVIATKIDGAKYTWLGPNVENANNDTLRTAVPGIYALTVEDTLYGCPALTADFTINQIGADLQVYASDVLVCPGTKVTVRANLDGFSNWNVAYAWSTEDTTSAAIATVSTDTTFVVTAFVTAPNSNNVCSLTDSINVFVYDTTSVQLVVNATPENICQGSQVNLKVRPIITSDATVAAPESYIWYLNGVEIPGQNLDSVILSLNEPGSYEFSVRPANQVCKVQPATYAQTPVTVYAIPDMYIAGDFVICTGDTAYLAPIIQPADDKFTFTWNTGSTDSLLKVTEAGVYHVYAVGDNGKCYANASFSVTTFGGDLHVSADRYSVCESEMVVLTANLDGMQNENIKYAWSQNVKGTITNLDTTSTLQVYPTDTTTYIVTAIAGNCTMVDSVTVNVILTPTTVDLTVSALEDTVCVGSQATISVTSNDNHSYVWYQNGVVIPGENLSAITVNLNEPGMYVYAATPANTACVVSTTEAMDTIWVFANPEVALTGNSVICNGDTAKILATVLNGNPADYTYLWSNNDNDSLLNVVDAGIYTVTVTNKNTKCEATADVAVTTFGGDLHVSADKYSVCESEMVVLTANLDGMQNENIKYAWSQNVKGTITNLDTTSTLQVYPTDTTTYIVTAIAGNCSMVDSVTVNVINTPTTVNITVSALEDTICVGAQATLSVASTDNHSYVWYQNGIVIPGENLNTIRVNLNEPGMYVYAATPANTGCVVSTTEAMDTIWVFANPEVYITGDHFYTVNGDSAKLFATKLENCIYVWSNGATTDSIVVADAAVYTVTVTDTLTGCSTTVEYKVDAVVNAQVNIVGVESACMSDVVTLTAVVDHDLIGVKYQWLIDGQYIPGATGQHYVFKTDTLYENTGLLTHDIQVEVTREGCEDLISPVHKFSIRPVPMAVITAPEYICEGDSATFVVNVYSLGSEEEYQYAWFQDDENTPYEDTISYINTKVFTAAELTGHKYGVKVLYQDTACATSVSDFVSVKFYEKPDQIHLTVNADTVCEGAQMFYTLENVADTLIPYINWFINGVKVTDAHDTVYSNVFENPGKYHVYATIAYDKYPCEVMYSNDTIINVFEQPTVQITGDPLICADSTVSLFAMINDTIGSKDYKYEWRLYNFTLADGDNYPEFASELEANYQNIAITFNSDSVNLQTTLGPQDHPYIFTTQITTEHGCVAKSEPYYVYVGENLSVAVTVDHDTVCKGGEVTATAHIGNYNWDNLVYQWYENDSLIPHGTSRIYTSVIDSTTVFSVVVKQTTTGCQVSGADSTTVVIPKNLHNIVVINDGDTARNVCEGAVLEVAAYFLDDNGQPYIDSSLKYVWTLNGMTMHNMFGLQNPQGPIFSHQAYIYDGDPVDYVYTVYVVYEDVPGCEMVPIASDTIHIKPNPVVTIDGTPNVCYFDEYTYNVNLTAWVDGKQDPDATYTWFESGQLRPNVGGADNRYNASWPATYLNPWIFEVVAQNGDGCTGRSEKFYVNVYDKPVVNITADADSICEGGSVTLKANLDNYNDPMLTYQWYENVMDDQHKLNGYTHAEETFNPSATTKYIVNVTHLMYSGSSSNHNASQYCWSADTFNVQVNAVPQIDSITNNLPDTNVVCDGYQVNLAAHISKGVQGGEVYTWYRNGEIIAGATGAEYTEVMTALNNEPTTYTYAVSVLQSASGCQSSVFTMSSFTVNPNPVVELTTDPIVCVETDSNIMLVANVYPAPETEVKFNWFENNAMFKSQTTEDTIYLNKPYRDYPYNFSVQLVNEYGCISESSADVYVNANPVVNITVSEDSICVGGEITLSASLNDWNADMLTFQWSDNGVEIPGATSLTYTVVPSLGTHKYTVNIEQLTSLCTATSNEITVEVMPDPVITSVTASQYTVCIGGQIEISAHVADTVEGEIFTWYKNGILIEGATASTIYDAPAVVDNNTQTYVYTAYVTRPAAGCQSLPVSSQTITVYPNPTVVITGDQHVCETDSVFLIANVDTIGYTVGNLHYTWYESGQIRDNMGYNLGDNQFFAEYMYARTEPYRFTVEVRRENDATGCVSRSEEFNVYVYTQPVVNITATETDICTNGEVTLTANLNDNNATHIVYQWYEVVESEDYVEIGYNADGSYKYDTVQVFTRVNIPGATSANYTTNVNTTTTFGVNVLQTHSTCTANDEIIINVNPIPVVTNVTVNNKSADSVCNGTQVTIAATIEPADAVGAIYTWYRNGEEILNVYGPSFEENVYTVNNQTTVNTYTAIVTLPASGCTSAMSDSAAVVTISSAPESVVISGQLVICDGGSTTLYANVTPNGNEATYQWFKDNVAIANSDSNLLVVNEPGSYKVTTSINNCSTTSDAVVVTVEQAPQLQLTATEYEICVGGETVISVEATGWNNDDFIYTWNNGFVGTQFTFVPEFEGNYKFVVTASQATSGCVAVDSIFIKVNNIPDAPQISVNNPVICDGGQVTLTIDNPLAGATYTWYENSVLIPGADQSTLLRSPVAVDGDPTDYFYVAKVTLPASGCESNLTLVAAKVTVVTTPNVSVTVVGNTEICEGGTTTLVANVDPVSSGYSYQWYRNNVIIPNATDSIYVVSDNANEMPYDYKVVVTANPGCTVEQHALPITVVAQPQVVAYVTEDTVCVGGTTTFYATVEGGVNNINGLNPFTYEWYNNLNTTEPIATTASYTTTGTEAAGNYTYWVVVKSPYGCDTVSNIVSHVVVADPTVTVSVAQGYPTTICDGGVTTLIASVQGGTGSVSYQWYKNGLPLYGETNPTLETDPLSYGIAAAYTVVVTQSGVGCSVVSTPFNVNVVLPYTVDITGNQNVCEGGTLTLTATVNNVINGDELTYQWYKIANGVIYPINGATSSQYSTSELLLGGSYEYFVKVTSKISGCDVESSSVTANVVAPPTVEIFGAHTVCANGDLILNAHINGGVDTTAYIYTWSWTGAASGQEQTATSYYVPTLDAASDAAAPYYFTVTITRNDLSGCTATSVPHQVDVLPTPTVSITADNSFICQNGEVTFTAHVSPVGTYNYEWTINDVAQVVNSNTITTTLATTGTISAQVKVQAANASGSCSTIATLALPVQVVSLPVVTITPSITEMCVGGTTTLTANVTQNDNISNAFTYQWKRNGNDLVGATSKSIVQALDAPGLYEYTLTVSHTNASLGCVSTQVAPVTIQVAEQPVVTLASQDGLAICEGGEVTLTATVTNYSNNVNGVNNAAIYGNMTFDWYSNGISTGDHNTNITTAQNQETYVLNNVGNYKYHVVVTPSGANCQPQSSNFEVVNVVSNPSWTDVHVYSENGTDVCLGETVTLFAAIQGGVSDYEGSTNGHIQWVVTDNNGNTINVSGGLGGNSYDIPTVPGQYIYTPTFLGNIGSGCQLTNTADVQQMVTVHSLPVASFTSGDGESLCLNDPSASVELVLHFEGEAPFHYIVKDNSGNLVADATTLANNVSIYVTPTEQTTYFISYVADAFCQNTQFESNATATVYVKEVKFDNNFFVSGCTDNGEVTIDFTVIQGNPNAEFVVVYENGLTASGTISNNTATFVVPTAPGDYNAVITIEGCSYNIVVRVLVGSMAFSDGTHPIMDQRWNDVVVVNNNSATNGGHVFIGFQWYKNGVAIPGATYSNYQDKDGLNGFYSVELIEQDENGNMVVYHTCEMYFNTVSSVKVYPVPANVRQEITIELDLTSEELEGAVLDIYSVTGAHISHVTDLQPITKIEGFKAQGTYFGRILTGTNEIKTVKFVIVK